MAEKSHTFTQELVYTIAYSLVGISVIVNKLFDGREEVLWGLAQ